MIIIIKYSILAIALLFATFFKTKRSLHMLQQNLYNENNRYVKWIFKNYKQFLDWDLLLVLITFIGSLVFFDLENVVNIAIAGLVILGFYVGFSWLNRIKNDQNKKPLVVTARIKRLMFTTFVLYFIPLCLMSCFIADSLFVWRMLFVLAFMIYFNMFVVYLANIINFPIERVVYLHYKLKAQSKLKNMSNLKIIGITGSYGKTSTKMFLTKFLEKKYIVCSSPYSYNTPMGITKVVLNDLKPEHNVLIAEMGATSKGDIKELCDMVMPNAGIITAVGEQHLDTFKSLENILSTKFELAEALKDKDFCVFNCASDNTQKLYEQCNLNNKVAVGDTNNYLYAKNIVATEDGLEFIICYNKKEYKTYTSILGEHNIQNILCAAALALKLGISIKQILEVIPTLQSVEHRLQLTKLEDNILIIDDSFNSNIHGTAVALETLSLFSDRRKIVVTPGLVELGKKENIENIELGKRIAKVADLVILVNKNQSDNLKKGLLEGGFSEENIYMQETLFEVTNLFKTILRSGDVVLLENDLPDNYK